MGQAGPDHYEVLGVLPTADLETIRRKYRELAKFWHPDRPGGDAGLMSKINEAFEILRDPVKRAAFDAARRIK